MSHFGAGVSVWGLVVLLASTADGYVVIDNFQEGAVNIKSGPYQPHPYPNDEQGAWVVDTDSGLSPANTLGGKRITAVWGEDSDWQSVQLTGGAMRFHLDANLSYEAYLRYDGLGGRALIPGGIAFDINYPPNARFDKAAAVRLTLTDTNGRAGSMALVAVPQGSLGTDMSGTYEFVFDRLIRSQVDLASINRIELNFDTHDADSDFAIDNIREVPEPAALVMLALGCAGMFRRKRA
jgi:hypothetical protein